MQIQEYFAVIRRYGRSISVAGVAGLLVFLAFAFLKPSAYVSSGRFLLTGSGATGSDLTAVNQYVSSRIPTYSQALKSWEVCSDTAKIANVGLTAGDLCDRLSVEYRPDMTLLGFAVTDSDPARTLEIAQAFTTAFPAFVERVEGGRPGLPGAIVAEVVDPPMLPCVPAGSSKAKLAIAGLAAGLLAGFALALVRSRFGTPKIAAPRVSAFLNGLRSAGRGKQARRDASE